MPTEQQWRSRISELIEEVDNLPAEIIFDDYMEQRAHSQRVIALASGWLASANAIAAAILPNPDAAHRQAISRITGTGANLEHREQMMRAGEVLRALVQDFDAGLFRSVADEATAMAFSDWLDHARELLGQGQKDIAGVVAGVAFEDTLRRLRALHLIEPHDIKLDTLIVELGKKHALTDLERKEAIAAAGLRTSAAHAKWEEFDAHQVSATIELTRRFLSTKFG